MSSPMDGFWQVVYEEADDRFVPIDGLWTNVSLRPSGFTIYAGGHFVHIRAAGGRHPSKEWPPSAADKIRLFKTAGGAAGTATWQEEEGSWTGRHIVEMSPDPRDKGRRFGYSATVEGEQASVAGTGADGKPFEETWRRLSGPTASALGGAWESRAGAERWMLLMSAGHYGVVREDLDRPALAAPGDLSEAEVLSICDSHGSNAGATVVGPASFDNHPFVATNSAGYEAVKHRSFRLASVDADSLQIGFRNDGTDASPWTRIGEAPRRSWTFDRR